jgi:hypothetical protein
MACAARSGSIFPASLDHGIDVHGKTTRADDHACPRDEKLRGEGQENAGFEDRSRPNGVMFWG